jgi:group II intron reverse transcriptase/maturase
MALKPEVKFDKLYQKLYNVELWLLAYQQLAPNPGNLTPGTDGQTMDGAGLKLISELIQELKTMSYKPKPARRVYLPKPNGKQRPIGIAGFRDKLVQTVVKLIVEAIYEPTFADTSHGFRPGRSCHTALQQVKEQVGIRWWIESDIKSFYDTMQHEILLRILSKRITDQRFLHLISQLMQAGYIENWQFHRTYSGVPQGSCLSPVLSNIYLNELDQVIIDKAREFNRGKKRKRNSEYHRISGQCYWAKKKARTSGDWRQYKALQQRMLSIPYQDTMDLDFRRLVYTRYADDALIGIIGTKAEALEVKAWLADYLKKELGLELSEEKTLITHASKRVRFLGYDIRRWKGERRFRFHAKQGTVTKRTSSYQLSLLIPYDKTVEFGKEYGNVVGWRGNQRGKLLNLSELEILMTYNSETRGFLNFYSLADNFSNVGGKVLWLTTSSFFRTLAGKRKSSVKKVSHSLKRGPNRYVMPMRDEKGQVVREYELVSSTRQFDRTYPERANLAVDQKATPHKNFQGRTELTRRILANQCEWCGSSLGQMEVHHVRKLKNLKGKEIWERQMMQRRRKTMVLCEKCHTELHAGKLKASKQVRAAS